MQGLLSSFVGCVLLCCEARAAMAQQPARQWELQKRPIPHPKGVYSATEGGKIMQGLFSGAVLAAVLIVLAGCALTEKALQERGLSPLTQSELEAMFSRTRTFHRTNAEGGSGTVTYTPAGVVKLDWIQGADEGFWWIAGDKFCVKYNIKYKPILRGGERCFTVYKTGENEYKAFNAEGSSAGTVSFTFTGGREELQF
jgi:hypothetical protein